MKLLFLSLLISALSCLPITDPVSTVFVRPCPALVLPQGSTPITPKYPVPTRKSITVPFLDDAPSSTTQ